MQRDPMPPGRWTALFFLDEATALAAGHRPCAFCRRPDFLDFAGAWREAQRLDRRPAARDMDAVLHRERVGRLRRQLTHRAPAGELPDGVMIRAGGGCRAVAGRPGVAVVLRRLRRPGRAQRAGRGGGADAAIDRGRDRGRLPAAGAPQRADGGLAGRPGTVRGARLRLMPDPDVTVGPARCRRAAPPAAGARSAGRRPRSGRG